MGLATGVTRVLEQQAAGSVAGELANGQRSASEIAMALYGSVDPATMKRVRREVGRMEELEQVVKIPGSGKGKYRLPDQWMLSATALWAQKASTQLLWARDILRDTQETWL